MAILPIRQYPDHVLKKNAVPVEHIDLEVEKLIEDMGETMCAAKGVGLAAPQTGTSRRIIIIGMSGQEKPEQFIELINPQIIMAEGEELAEEGCLSVADYKAKVRRALKIKVSYHDKQAIQREMEAEGIIARILQHEIDHLNGLLFFERLSRIKRDLIKRRLIKRAKHNNSAS